MNVYIMKDPHDLTVRYVGLTSKPPLHRMRGHMKAARTKERQHRKLNGKDRWLLKLDAEHRYPVVVCMVMNIDIDVGIEAEKNVIAIYGREREGGTLYNIQPGGSYSADKIVPWNRGRHGCYRPQLIREMKRHQSNRKTVYRFDTDCNFIDEWVSTRTMCDELNLDRRTVQRCLAGKPHFNSHKGYRFSYTRNGLGKQRQDGKIA